MGPSAGGQPGWWGRTFAAFQHREYRRLWIAFAATFLALQMQLVGNLWLAFELTGSFTKTALIALAWGLSMFLLTLVGGAIGDRVDRRRLTLYTQSTNVVVATITAVVVFSDAISFPLLFVVALVHASMFAINMPGRQAQVADVLPQADLMNGVALAMASANASRIVGPAIAGVVIGASGAGPVYLLVAAMYGLTVLLQFTLPKGPSRDASDRATEEQRPGVFREIGLGFRYIASEGRLRLLLLIAFIPTLIGGPFIVMLAGFAEDDLELGDWGFGALLAVNGIGALVGSIVVASLANSPRKALLQSAMVLGAGLSLLALGAGSDAFGVPAAFVAMALLGVSLVAYQVLNNTMVMGASDPAYYGRMMSVLLLTNSVTILAAMPLGLLADRVGPTRVFEVQGALILVFIVALVLLNPRYVFGREADKVAGIKAEPVLEAERTEPSVP